MQIEADQLVAAEQKDCNAECAENQDGPDLEAEGIADTRCIAASAILRSKNTGAGNTAEDAEIIDKQELVDDGDTGHLVGADPADHDIVEEAYKVGDAALYHDGDSNCQNHMVKSRCSDILFSDAHKGAHFLCAENAAVLQLDQAFRRHPEQLFHYSLSYRESQREEIICGSMLLLAGRLVYNSSK